GGRDGKVGWWGGGLDAGVSLRAMFVRCADVFLHTAQHKLERRRGIFLCSTIQRLSSMPCDHEKFCAKSNPAVIKFEPERPIFLTVATQS
ncbi:MAG: hypothetical protein WBA02_14940, partial [Jannaschia helgolandensis]|uniref:hypothetical protein n=1 Tax=Jannaschia helgolandensis TaxID=188906 RepID=UPI003C7396B1